MIPKVSVLMAVRNGGDYLDASLRSIAAQTFADWEMVVVDDASTDSTPQVLSAWARRDQRVRVFSNPVNAGQTPSLNRGLRECRGEWVARQDADDLSAPERIAAQMEFLRDNPAVLLLGTQGVLIDENDRKVGLLDVPASAPGIAWTSLFLNPFLHTSVVFRRDFVLGKFGGYDEAYRIAQDYDLWARMLNEVPSANLAARLVSYRRSDASLSRAGHDLAFAESDRVADRQARHLLGRELSPGESALTAQFRRGLPSRRRSEFRLLSRRLAAEFAGRHPGWKDGPATTRGAWHLRLAGSAGSGMAAVSEVFSALLADPVGTTRWLRERFA